MANPRFIHLNCHSSYSLLEGVPSIKALAQRAKALGMPALGVTDTNNLFGTMDMSKYPVQEGVQPLLGTQLGITLDAGNGTAGSAQTGLITLLIQNEKGWRNALKLSSKAFLEAPENEPPQVTLDDIKGFSDGLICLTGSAREGALGKLLLTRENQKADALIATLSTLFEGRLYVEIQRHGMKEERAIEDALLALAYDKNLPLVATNDCRFLDKDQAFAFEVMLGIGDSKVIADPERRQFSAEHYFKTEAQMLTLFADLPEATENTVTIAKRCAYKVPTGVNYMPQWIKEEGDTREVDQIMIDQAQEGLEMRLREYVYLYEENMSDARKEELRQAYQERLKFEIDIIINMGYPGYFLITSDFIRWAKANDIPVGPGRGSGAGSLVAWAMEITEVDPIQWGLYFERFLNPERVSLPDFDIDFCPEGRDRVIGYVREKYGYDAVSQIITFGTLKAKACIRDVGRVMQMSFGAVSQIAAFIPEGPETTPIADVLKDDERLRSMYETDDDIRSILDIAMQLEGAYRHASTHAAGVIIADRSIDEVCALFKDPRSDMPATQFSMFDAEASGLVKFDFLGLKTLTVIKYALDFIEKNGGPSNLDPNKFPLDDEKTFNMLKKGQTIGVFQVESQGMTDFLKKMDPDRFQFLSDVIALYRPGPLGSGMADDFVECRHGRKAPNYPHAVLEPVLKETYGVPVYQEQVMRMAQELAGYTLGGADMLRRAMGKKKPEEMAKQRTIFVEGAKEKNNVPEKQANVIFDLMEKFSAYGFNKAHTIAYGLVSYQTAWLKANYPVEFMAASMTLDRGNSDKVLKFKRELERMEIPLYGPDVNKSGLYFHVEGEGIRFSLGAIKGAGDEAIRALENERRENGAYTDIYDFMERQEPRYMNRRQLEVLIKAGAFDNMEENRAFLLENVDVLLGYMQTMYEEKNSNQIGLFGGGDTTTLAKPELKTSNNWDLFEKLEKEQQAIGFYLSSHPLKMYADDLKLMRGIENIVGLRELAEKGRTGAKIAVIVHGKREMKTKSGKRMAFLTISDATGQEEIVLFPKAYDVYYEILEKNRPLLITLEMKVEDDRLRASGEVLQDLEDQLKKQARVRIGLMHLDALPALKETLEGQPKGQTKCEIHYSVPQLGNVVMALDKPIDLTKRCRTKLEAINHVVVN